MPVVKETLVGDFTQVDNSAFKNPLLTLRDIGLLAYMTGKPPQWKFTVKNIVAELPNDGTAAIRASVKRLQQAGYLRIEQQRGPDGKLRETTWTVCNKPCFIFPHAVNLID